MNCLIVGGGSCPSKEIFNLYASKSDLIIGVDKGCNYLYDENIMPKYIIGDFDSSSNEVINKLQERGAEKYKFKCEKDSTDSQLAFDLANEKGASKIFFLGSTGGRFDHTLGNLGLLIKGLKFNINVNIIDDKNIITIVNKSSIINKEKGYKYISFLAYGKDVKSLSIEGAKYNLKHYDLAIGDGRTISNEFIDDKIKIEISDGSLLIIHSKD